jgi:hypothetical protein
MTQATGNSAHVNASGDQLGCAVVTQLVKVRIQAKAIREFAVPLGDGRRDKMCTAVRRQREDEGVGGQAQPRSTGRIS